MLCKTEIFEQGAGILDLDSAFQALKVHRPHASLLPSKVSNLPEGTSKVRCVFCCLLLVVCCLLFVVCCLLLSIIDYVLCYSAPDFLTTNLIKKILSWTNQEDSITNIL